MKYTFIVNPNSGNAKHDISLDFLQSKFDSSDEIVLKETVYQFHAKELVKEAIAENSDVIVACGGDGTINEVASALVKKNIPLGIIPAGSGNGLATNLNIPKDINKAIEIIKNHIVHTIDVGRVEDNYFFSNLGFGIDAEVIKTYEENQKRTITGYVDASVKTLLNEDLDVFEQFYFSVLVLAKKIDLLDKAKYRKVKKFKIESLDNNPITYQLDGEIHNTDSLQVKVKVLPNALKIIF